MDLQLSTKPARKPRAYFSKEFKQRLVAQCRAGNRSVSSIAREHDLHVNLLFRWTREFAQDDCSISEPRLLPVRVVDDDFVDEVPSGSGPEATNHLGSGDVHSSVASLPAAESSIVLTTPAGVRLQIVGTPDEKVLSRVLQMAFA